MPGTNNIGKAPVCVECGLWYTGSEQVKKMIVNNEVPTGDSGGKKIKLGCDSAGWGWGARGMKGLWTGWLVKEAI